MKGSQESLTTVVVKDAANWPTPDTSNHRDGEVLRKDNNLEQGGFHGVSLHHAMTKYGQAAQANPSTDGSRQGSWVDWRTPQANEAGARVETLYTKDGQPARLGERAYRKTPDGRMVLQSQTINQQVEMVQNWVTPRTSGTSTRPNKTTPRQGLTLIEQAREQEKMWRTPSVAEEKNQNTSTQIYLQNQVGATPKAWATPKASDPQHSGPNMRDSAGNYALPAQAVREQWATPIMGDSHLASTPEVAQKRIEEGKVTLSRQIAAQWATPRSGKTTDENPETWAVRQAKGDVATMPLTAQVKAWATPQAHDAQGPKTPEQIAAMRAKGHGVKNLNEQACWGTTTARDHKSGRGNEEREYKELTPMVERTQTGKLNPRWVETLMGLPVGWVMPSCASPVTIEPTNCDFSATESCLPPQSELLEF
jgi:hypothetical protein